jgi:FkbM family methyltransferase
MLSSVKRIILTPFLQTKIVRRILIQLNIPIMYTFDKSGIILSVVHPFIKPQLFKAVNPKKGETVVECGAYTGRLTLRLAASIKPSGKIIAIEPNPEAFRLLLLNLRLNNAAKCCIPLNIAVSDESGSVRLFISKWPATHSIVYETNKSVEVQAKSLDKITEELDLDQIDWLVMDVEGAEVKILKGATKLLTSRLVTHIVIEAHNTDLLNECLRILRRSGYECLVSAGAPSYIIARKSNGKRLILL